MEAAQQFSQQAIAVGGHAPVTNYAIISVLAAPWEKWFLSRNNDRLFSSVLPLSRR
jgi:hypothetical protein